MYTVIARRWRPKRFEEVVGQYHIVRTLQNSIRYNRTSHAYLFAGPRGVGKTSLARIFAKALNCEKGPREEPCCSCENCVSIDNGTFVDVIEIDAASARRIEDIRELSETVKYFPLKGRYKVYILDESHMLTMEARNAFLKTLEEPPLHTVFILATTEPQKIPQTIMSRCQRFDFRRISERDMVGQLCKICQNEGIECEEEALGIIAEEADGSLRDAESIFEKVLNYKENDIRVQDVLYILGIVEKEILFSILKSILDNDVRAGLHIIEETVQKGYEPYEVYRGLLMSLRKLLFLKIYGDCPPFLYMSQKEYERFLSILQNVEYYEIQNMLYYLIKHEDSIRGEFPKLSLEIIFINLCNLSKIRDIERLIEEFKENETKKLPQERETQKSIDGFLQFLRARRPFLASLMENMNLTMENQSLIIGLSKDYNLLREDKEMKEDLRLLLKEYFGESYDVLITEDQREKEQLSIDEYVYEAKKIFGIKEDT